MKTKTFLLVPFAELTIAARIFAMSGEKLLWVAKPYTVYPPLRSVRVTYENGDVMATSMAAGLTDAEMLDYYKPGSVFNVGRGPDDNMQTVAKVEILV